MNLKHFLSGCCCAALLMGLPVSAYTQDLDQNDKFLQPRAEVSVKGGTDRSLLTTEFWAPLAQERDRVLYGDIRLMGDNDENREGNLGVGYRQVVEDYVLGGHAWIDRRRTTNNSTFHQATFGVERLGHIVDIRANGYIPLNNGRHVITPSATNTPYLAGSGIFYDTNGLLVETPQYGADAEIGYRFPIFPKQIDTFRVYGGGYHFFRKDTENVTGFRIRTEAQINKAISIGARFQHDGPRGSQGFLEATLKFPFSAKKLYHEDYIRSRLDESPERDVDIVTDAKRDTGMMKPIINTASGAQQRVLYVDNSNTQTGDGTKENPFNNLKAAEAALQANDILYVNHGDGTTTGMDKGIVIDKAGVSLIGSGSNFVYDAGKFSAQNGANFNGVLLAAAGTAPTITNTDAFVNDGLGTTTSHSGNGIYVTGKDITISGISVVDANASGIFVTTKAGNVFDEVNISNVTATGSKNGRGILIQALEGAGIKNINITNSTVTNSLGGAGRGIEIRIQDANSFADEINIGGNTVNGTSALGIYALANSGGKISNAHIFNNDVTGSNGYGIHAYANLGSQFDKVIIENNRAQLNNNIGIYISSSSSQFGQALAQNNVSNGNNFGVYARADSNGTISDITVQNNETNGNNSSGIYIIATSASIAKALVDGNTSNNNTVHGVYFYSVNAASSITNAVVSNNVLTGNGTHGIYLFKGVAGGVLNVDLGGGAYQSVGHNSIFGNTGNDVRLNYAGGGAIIARNNYWGGGALTRIQVSASTTIDSTAFLVTNPNN